MNWITGIQRALDYVEAHLMESVDYEEAAKQAYSSSFHFQRVFSILCGFTLGDYIRMRRLTLAGSELASSDIRVIDAALKYGYDTRRVSAVPLPAFTACLPHRQSMARRSKLFPLFP